MTTQPLIDREISRREAIPSIIEMLTKKVGILIAMFRVDNAVILKLLRSEGEMVHVRLNDDQQYSKSTATSSGRHVEVNTEDPSLLDVVPLCKNQNGCGFGCGCRCSHDLGYTISTKHFCNARRLYGGSVFLCHSSHTEPRPAENLLKGPPTLNVEKMVHDLEVQL